jgi:hypothetical protein
VIVGLNGQAAHALSLALRQQPPAVHPERVHHKKGYPVRLALTRVASNRSPVVCVGTESFREPSLTPVAVVLGEEPVTLIPGRNIPSRTSPKGTARTPEFATRQAQRGRCWVTALRLKAVTRKRVTTATTPNSWEECRTGTGHGAHRDNRPSPDPAPDHDPCVCRSPRSCRAGGQLTHDACRAPVGVSMPGPARPTRLTLTGRRPRPARDVDPRHNVAGSTVGGVATRHLHGTMSAGSSDRISPSVTLGVQHRQLPQAVYRPSYVEE